MARLAGGGCVSSLDLICNNVGTVMDVTEEIAMVFGLANRCPFGQATAECPLGEVRKLTLKQRYDAIHNLPVGCHHELILHRDCSGSRTRAG